MAKHHKESLVVSAWRACTWNILKQCLFNLIGKLNKRKKEKKQINNKWVDIPEDVLEMIMKRLSLKDYVRLRAVCPSWRAIVSNAIANKHYCQPLPELPCICLFSDASTSFNLKTERELFQKSLVLNSYKQNKICYGTVEGWLILGERVEISSFAISFFNPVTHATILVPSVLKFPYPIQEKLLLKKMVASSEPNSSSKSDCCLFGFFNDYSHIAYCKLNDMSWNMIELKKEFQVWDVEIIGSKLYVMAISKTNKSLDSIMVYDLVQDSSSKPPKAKVLAKLPPWPNPIITQSGTKRTICGSILRYIAKDGVSGELFLIYMFCDFTYEMEHVNCFDMITECVIPPKITSVKVFMLDTKKKKKKTTKWKKVKDLGDRVLFVSFSKSIVMSKATLNSSNTVVTKFLGMRYVGILQDLFRRIVTMGNTEEVIQGNNIYFAAGYYACPSNPWEGVKLGKICLIDNSIKYFSVKKSNHPKKIPIPCWFLPSV